MLVVAMLLSPSTSCPPVSIPVSSSRVAYPCRRLWCPQTETGRLGSAAAELRVAVARTPYFRLELAKVLFVFSRSAPGEDIGSPFMSTTQQRCRHAHNLNKTYTTNYFKQILWFRTDVLIGLVPNCF